MLRHILLIVIYFTQWFIYLRASKTYIKLHFLKKSQIMGVAKAKIQEHPFNLK